MIEQEFTRKLFSDAESNLSIKLDTAELIKTDKTAESSYYSTMLQNGIMCINEVRHALGLSPISGGDKHVIPYTNLDQNQINNKEDKSETDNKKTELEKTDENRETDEQSEN